MQINLNIKKLLGKKIKELRKERGFTQAQLAEKIEIGERNLSKIECGNSFITAETLSKLLIAFEIEANELFNFEHLKDESDLKTELLKAIENDLVDIKLIYKFYKSIKNNN